MQFTVYLNRNVGYISAHELAYWNSLDNCHVYTLRSVLKLHVPYTTLPCAPIHTRIIIWKYALE
jgi:hypothetical protein